VTQPQGKLDVAWSLMEEVKVSMVVTHDGDNGRMRAGPMAAQLDPDASAIFFQTDAQAAKDKEIDLNDNVCLVFSDVRKQHYVSLTGRAELSDDRAKIKQLWSSLDSAFWSDANDPSIRALKITPTIAEILGPRRRQLRAPSKLSERRSREAYSICVRTKKWSCPEREPTPTSCIGRAGDRVRV
jgi:general stress protein 26